MKKKKQGFDFSITGITENNLKNIDISASSGEIILISGISGSGKSTLVNDVIASEARRQERMRRKSDDLYTYAVRPSFEHTTDMPSCISVSQRSLTQTELSTFGTRTGIKGAIQRVFVEKGRITYLGVEIKKPSISEIRKFAKRFYPSACLYAVLASYTNITAAAIRVRLEKHKINSVLLRDEKRGTFKEVTLTKLPKTDLSNYEISVPIEACLNDCVVGELSKSGVVLLGPSIDLNFDEYYFHLPDGMIFRKPSLLLFSRSGASSLSGRCESCLGNGKEISVDFDNVINKSAIIQNGFLNVPLTKAGRYVAFKFLPSGLATLLKKQDIDVRKKFDDLSLEEREVVFDILTKKLMSNQADEYVKTYLSESNCSACDGTGYGYQNRAVLINGKPFYYYLSLPANAFRAGLPQLMLDDAEFSKLDRQLDLIEKLAIGHISLDRSTTTISSGEAQRLKLLDVLMSNDSGKIIVLDEPSSNLQYGDNLAILDAIIKLKCLGNCILLVEHNPLYRSIADRIIEVGPGAGVEGGHIREGLSFGPPMVSHFSPMTPSATSKSLKFSTLRLKPKRNIRITGIKIPFGKITAVIGSSGAGKSTLVLEMIYACLLDSGEAVVKLDSKPPGKSSASIVATYIEVFDSIRKVYARIAAPFLSESDFSFNAKGACAECGGGGYDGDKVCGVCFGSRYRSNVTLTKAENVSIVELLARNIDHIDMSSVFGFLAEAREVFNALSLTHITLGRSTSTLSGGELQRLKLAKFILNNRKAFGKGLSTVILDEPSRGLDESAVARLHAALGEYIKGCTIIVIEHNPTFIYRCDYVIDMGNAIGEKTKDNIVVGALGETEFPSLNHNAVLAEVEKKSKVWKENFNDSIDVKVKLKAIEVEGKRYHLLHPIYLSQKNFEMESSFSSNFQVEIKDKNYKFFYSREQMEVELSSAKIFLYNPFIPYLEKYSKIPASIYKTTLLECRNAEVYQDEDPWKILVKASTFEEAFLKGGGVVATHQGTYQGTEKCFYYGIRLFSVRERVVDRIFPSSFAFNLYRNACSYCHGYGHVKSYPFQDWIDKKFSPLDPKMTFLGLNKVMPKATIAYFAKEKLFDFTLPPLELTKEEYNILLYGFKSYKFLKAGRTGVVEDDYWEWRGLNSYIYNNSSKLSEKKDLDEYLCWKKCPFCTFGFRSSVKRYYRDEKTIESYLKI